MATKKDLVEAYSFSRRRLVTAFVSGAPGGREVEPARPGRSVVGGLALGVLLIAGAAIAGVFTTNVDPAWAEQPGLVISKEEAEVFVITDASSSPVLHPILNITSAKLILGADVEPQVIPEEYIAEETIGSDLGIFGAPYDVPDVERLVETGWTACTAGDGAEGGLRLAVSGDPQVTPAAASAGTLVTVDDETWLVATSRPDSTGAVSAHRYLVPDAETPAQVVALTGIGLGTAAERVEVSREWLDLFPEGAPVSPDSFAGVTPRVGGSGEPRPGDVVTVSGTPYLTTADGELAELDPFALGVATGGETGPDYDGEAVFADEDPLVDNRWPGAGLDPVFGERCAQLESEPGRAPRVVLAQEPEGEAAAGDSSGESVWVAAGSGAFVRSGGWDVAEGGSPFVVDAKGVAYPLVGPGVGDLLGYEGYDEPVVPDSWIELFDQGVQLSQNGAFCEPSLEDGPCG
ncbi:type VII secretion protein EccB [Nocardioides aestuarii]|uniref:Type VII secretion protein EccB n=1 Tax=Nocardioides aestuarii TaxID=252231 RepID=A0ABW4TNU9_9ACTN